MNFMIEFFKNGGPFMYPIGLVLVVGLAVALDRWVFLSAAKSSNKKMFNKLLPLLKKRDFSSVIELARSSKAPIGRIVAAGIARMQQTPRREEIECAMDEGVMEIVPRLQKRTAYLATLANIATLLGLLGTIMGLIDAFTAVANAEPTEKAALLSQSISLAMNTTAFGLMSAIPLLLLHAAIVSKTTEIIDSLEMAGIKCMNIMSSANVIKSRTRENDPQ